MDNIIVIGGIPLYGKIEIGGAKNAALPIMAACLLTKDCLTLSNIPFLADITTMAGLLVRHGVSLTVDGSQQNNDGKRILSLKAHEITNTTAPYDIVRKMRASVVVLGPLLARAGNAKVSLPGGCAIGSRPIDLHLEAFEKMGAKINLKDGYIEARTDNGLHGAEINFPFVSVGATENVLMAATLAKGVTIIKNAAKEPEISDLANCLNQMGADIKNIGTDTLEIIGVSSLHGASYSVMPDRIEAGSYAVAALITGGDIEILGVAPDIMKATLEKLVEAGAIIKETENGIRIKSNGMINPVNIDTKAYPDFATDMQAQMTALMCIADGDSIITENIFENRFMHVPELQRMGARISLESNSITVHGKDCHLKGAEVMATDLRASVSLVLAALAAKGKTTIRRVYHIDRGYERIEEKLSACGAKIERIKSV